MFQSVISPEGSSRLSDKLDPLVSEYRGQLKRYIDSNPAKPWRPRTSPKKAIYVVLTDGNHADTRKIVDIVADMANFLKTIQAPSTQFGIEFVQIGEPSDFEWLHRAMDQDEKVRVSDITVLGSVFEADCGTYTRVSLESMLIMVERSKLFSSEVCY